MAKHEKAPADAVNIDEGAAGMALGSSIPVFDCTERARGKQGIFWLLLCGEQNAQSAGELAQIAGCKPREVTREIEQLRLDGVPVCAGRYGYFIAGNTAELERYCKAFNRRLRSIKATAAALGDMIAEAAGQETIWDGGNDG